MDKMKNKKQETQTFNNELFNVINTTTDKIKKGDRIFIKEDYLETAESDSYQKNGIYSFDFDKIYTYGFQGRPTPVKVLRKTIGETPELKIGYYFNFYDNGFNVSEVSKVGTKIKTNQGIKTVDWFNAGTSYDTINFTDGTSAPIK